jgi:hypothetical protein
MNAVGKWSDHTFRSYLTGAAHFEYAASCQVTQIAYPEASTLHAKAMALEAHGTKGGITPIGDAAQFELRLGAPSGFDMYKFKHP